MAESMVARMAAKSGESLSQKFWTISRWERAFRLQLQSANSLLKIYDFEVIKAALNTKEGKRIYSLGAKWLIPLLETEAMKFNHKQRAVPETEPEETKSPEVELPTGPRPTFSNSKSQLNKLRELDS